MEDFGKLNVAIASAEVLHKLNKSIFDGTNEERVPALKTNETDVKIWWNKLTYIKKLDVIGHAVSCNLTTANSRWGFGNFEDYSKQKQRIIRTIFNKRKQDFKAFDLASMLKI